MVRDTVFDASDPGSQTRARFARTGTLSRMSAAEMQSFLVAESSRFDNSDEVCCIQGRERSALRVFAALWVRHEQSKEAAATAVASAVKRTQGSEAARQSVEFLTLSNWWPGLDDDYQPGG